MQKKAKKSENYLHLCKIFRNFVAEICSERRIPTSKHHEYETFIYSIDCCSSKRILCNDTRAKCNGATSAEYKH